MKEIIIATNNEGKVKEIKEIIKDIKVKSLKEEGIEIKVEENEDTFEKNALKKALEVSKLTKKTCIADDSGLCIKKLNGFPGTLTDRFLGENATQEEKNNYILEKMKKLTKEERKAEVITCIAIVYEDGNYDVLEGTLKGYIAQNKRGKNGFGFDEIFELENGKTLAEITQEEKNKISSRRKALDKLKDKIIF